MSQNVLIVVTSTPALPDGRETGFDWISVAVPYWRLREAGCRIGFASPAGGKPPGDPATATEADGDRSGAVDMFLGDAEAVASLAASAALAAVDPEDWHGVLVAGGLGALWDVGQSEDLATLMAAVWDRGGVLAAIGTGVLALARPRDGEGRRVVAGRFIAAPDDAAFAELLEVEPPALPESALRAVGAQVVLPGESGTGSEAVEDGRLVTASDARGGADLTLDFLGALAIHGSAMTRRAETEEAEETEEDRPVAAPPER